MLAGVVSFVLAWGIRLFLVNAGVDGLLDVPGGGHVVS